MVVRPSPPSGPELRAGRYHQRKTRLAEEAAPHTGCAPRCGPPSAPGPTCLGRTHRPTSRLPLEAKVTLDRGGLHTRRRRAARLRWAWAGWVVGTSALCLPVPRGPFQWGPTAVIAHLQDSLTQQTNKARPQNRQTQPPRGLSAMTACLGGTQPPESPRSVSFGLSAWPELLLAPCWGCTVVCPRLLSVSPETAGLS